MKSISSTVFTPVAEKQSEKKCSGCQVSKQVGEFYLEPSGRLRSHCKACICTAAKIRDAGRYQRNPDQAKARVKRWIARHPDQHREIMRKAVAGQRRKKREAGTPPLPLDMPPPQRGGAE